MGDPRKLVTVGPGYGTAAAFGSTCGDWAPLFRTALPTPVGEESRKGRPKNCPFHTSRVGTNVVKLTVVTFNVRTLLDVEDSGRFQRGTDLIAKELGRYNVDIATITESRFA